MKPCKAANYFIKVNFRVVVRIWSNASPNHFLDLKLESLFYYQKYIYNENPTKVRKTVETGVDSCMSLLKPWITLELNFIMISFFAIDINIT